MLVIPYFQVQPNIPHILPDYLIYTYKSVFESDLLFYLGLYNQSIQLFVTLVLRRGGEQVKKETKVINCLSDNDVLTLPLIAVSHGIE